MRLKILKLGRCWWIVGDEEDGPYGPYSTHKEAQDDLKGLRAFFRNRNDRSFFTAERKTDAK